MFVCKSQWLIRLRQVLCEQKSWFPLYFAGKSNKGWEFSCILCLFIMDALFVLCSIDSIKLLDFPCQPFELLIEI